MRWTGRSVARQRRTARDDQLAEGKYLIALWQVGARLGRQATSTEVASELDVSLRTVESIRARICPMDLPTNPADWNASPAEIINPP